MRSKYYSQGMSFVEILVAMTISLILMAGVLQIMSSSKRTYALQDELSKLQENARFVIDDIMFGLRMAGYVGCSGSPPVGLTVLPIVGQDIVPIRDSSTVPVTATNGAILVKGVPASDTLTLTYFNDQLRLPAATQAIATFPAANFALGVTTITLDPTSVIPSVGDQLIVSDCGDSITHTVQAVAGTVVTLTAGLTKSYQWPVTIYRVPPNSAVRYEVRGIDRNNNNSFNDPEDGFALFKTGADGNLQQFIDGVENMQVRFGVDINGDGIADRYDVPSANPVGRIVSVRVTLLMRTMNRRTDFDGTDNRTFPLDAVNYDPSTNAANENGYRHRLFTTTISVRN